MKKFLILLQLAGWEGLAAQHQTSTLDEPHLDGSIPYTVDIREVSLAPAPLPNIHSVATGEWQGQWVFLAGRTNGLHGMTARGAFDPLYENREVWVVDPVGRQSWHKSLEDSDASGLSQDEIDSLSSVNTQFFQEGGTLLIVGGYGFKRSVDDHRTYDTLTALDLEGLVQWVKETPGSETTRARDHIKQIRDSYFQVTGGHLEKIGDEYQLVFGQNYEGRYRPRFNGIYTRQVRRFRMTLAPDGTPVVPPSSKRATSQNEAYRRRDLNVLPLVERSGLNDFEEKVVVLSGVFTPDDGVWTAPVMIGAGGQVSMDSPTAADTLKQGFQIYHCAKASLFHRVTNESHFLLFGGITVLERDLASGNFTRDDQAPFTNQCSLVVRDAVGRFRQYWLPTRFPLIRDNGLELRFGTNAEFHPSPEIPQLSHKVLDLAAITGEVVLGHIFGGIVADAGNSGNTGASGRVFEVVLTPKTPAPVLALENNTLTWRPGPFETTYLVEESDDLTTWREKESGLTETSLPLDGDSEKKRFYRVLGATPTSP
jgi:hypothetical protein